MSYQQTLIRVEYDDIEILENDSLKNRRLQLIRLKNEGNDKMYLMKEVHKNKEDDQFDLEERIHFIEKVEQARSENNKHKNEKVQVYVGILIQSAHCFAWITLYKPHYISLHDVMTDKELSFSLFSENKKRSYCDAIVRQLGEALSFLHEEAGAVHGDLSLRNILIRLPDENNNNSSTIEVKLIDWENGFLSNNNNDNSIIGRSDTTTLYGPPERLLHLNDNHHNGLSSVDVWALGIIVFQLYTEKVNVYPLFDIVDSNNMFQFMSDLSAFVHSSHAIENVIQQQIMHYDKKNKDSTRVISFITKCLQIDPNNRSSVEELMKEENFPFF